jgi:hypothetical protein
MAGRRTTKRPSSSRLYPARARPAEEPADPLPGELRDRARRPLDRVLEDEWKSWTAFDGAPGEPPKPMSLRRTPPKEKAAPRRRRSA